MAGIAAQRRKRFACSMALCGGRQLTLTRTSVVASAYLPSACTRAHQGDLPRPPITGPGFAIWRPRLKPRSAFGVDTCVLVPGVYCISPRPHLSNTRSIGDVGCGVRGLPSVVLEDDAAQPMTRRSRQTKQTAFCRTGMKVARRLFSFLMPTARPSPAAGVVQPPKRMCMHL